MACVRIYVSTQSGFRGASTSFQIFQQLFFCQSSQLSYNSVRRWTLRLGYALLNQRLTKRSDWIYILDYSIQVGSHRCLLILGVSREQLMFEGYSVRHDQAKVLSIHLSSTHTGQDVYDCLQQCIGRTGVPWQIIMDGGPDIAKGVKLLLQQYPNIICTNDISHKIGNILKHRLGKSRPWLALQEDLYLLRQQIKQGPLYFLQPLTLNQKSRWLGLEKLIDSLSNIYDYSKYGDFSLIEPGYKIKNHEQLAEQIKPKAGQKRQFKKVNHKIAGLTFEHKRLSKNVGVKELYDIKDQIEWEQAGKLKFEQKFECLNKHEDFFRELKQLFGILCQIKILFKTKGLSLDTLQDMELLFDAITIPWIRSIYFDILNFLIQQHAKAGAEPRPLLICTDVIESIFGKFKNKLKQSVGGLYSSVLVIPLFCEPLNPGKISELLGNTTYKAVEEWSHKVAGKSNLAKRRQAFCFTQNMKEHQKEKCP